MTLGKDKFYLNRFALSLFPNGKPERLEILRDTDTGQIALRPTESLQHSYKLYSAGGAGGGVIEAKLFLQAFVYPVPIKFNPTYDPSLSALVLQTDGEAA